MRFILAALCLTCWSFAAAADVARERAALEDAYNLSKDDHADLKALSAKLDAVIADKSFAELDDGERHDAYILAGAVRYDLGDYTGAEPLIERATAMKDAGHFDWHLLVENAFRLQNLPQAAAGMTALARNWPDQMDFNDHAIFQVTRELRAKPDMKAQAEALENALFDMQWKPSDEFSDADAIWLSLLTARVEHGDVEGAKRVAALLEDPTSAIALNADKRFDAIVAADPDRFDVMKQFDLTLARERARAAAAPDKLEGINTVAGLLTRLGRPQEALALIEDALARDAKDPKTFRDRDDQINWAQDQLSSIMLALGRSDEAIAALEKGAALKEHGAINVSQAINLGGVYYAHGRPADTLKAVAALSFSDVSGYGRMALQEVRACAYELLGDRKGLAEPLAYVKAHVRDGSGPFIRTMLCVGDEDALAAEVIAQLADPERRASMLSLLQDYPPDPQASETDRKLHEAWLAMRRRGDVIAAVAKAGRIASYPIYGLSY
jgi:tetratricopeptide (TPR) repeat protein